MKNLTISTLGSQSIIFTYDTKDGDKFTGLKAYEDENGNNVKGTREEMEAYIKKVSK